MFKGNLLVWKNLSIVKTVKAHDGAVNCIFTCKA